MDVDVIGGTLGPNSAQPVVVEATVTLLSEREGGKSRPITAPYRPNHNFGGPDNLVMYIGQVDIPRGEWMRPGETRSLQITFLNGPGLAEKLTPGTKWRLQEGRRLIGTAEVIRLVRAA